MSDGMLPQVECHEKGPGAGPEGAAPHRPLFATGEADRGKTAAGALIRLDDVTMIYRRGTQETRVFEGLTFTVAEGDFVALLGPSGSGKTTLLNLIAGIERPTRGRVTVGGIQVSALSERDLAAYRARHIGYVFQLYNLIPALTSFENVELPLLLTPLPKRERRAHVARALDLVGLAHRKDHYPGELSGGEQQRVSIARAIVADPTVLLADEPTGELDARNAEGVLRLLARLNAEFRKTIVMVTHDQRAAGWAGRRRRLEKGVLEPEAPPAQEATERCR